MAHPFLQQYLDATENLKKFIEWCAEHQQPTKDTKEWYRNEILHHTMAIDQAYKDLRDSMELEQAGVGQQILDYLHTNHQKLLTEVVKKSDEICELF